MYRAALPLAVALLAHLLRLGTAENILWCGGVTDTTANFRVESAAAVDFFVISNTSSFPDDLSAAVLSIQIMAGVTAIDMAPLPSQFAPMTTYFYGLESEWKSLGRHGRFRTMPTPGAAQNFSFAFASCARTGSDHAVFSEVMRLQDQAEGSNAPHLFFLHMGDIFYEDIEDNDVQKYRSAYKDVWSSGTQSALYRNRALVYMWDDHDFGENDSNGQSPSKSAAMKSYQMFVPHYPLVAQSALAAGDPAAFEVPIYQAFTVGRVRFLLMDLRSMSEPAEVDNKEDWANGNHPTMLGTAQKAWLDGELATYAQYGMMVLVSTKPWTGAADDSSCCKWMNYPDERVEVANMIKARGVDNLVAVAGDSHMVAYDDGSNTDYASGGGAGFPLLHSAPLDQASSFKGGPYSHGCFAPETTVGDWMKRIMSFGSWNPDTQQFSVLEVTDTGGDLQASSTRVCFKAVGYRYNDDTQLSELISGAVLEKCSTDSSSIGKSAGNSAPGSGECQQADAESSNKSMGIAAVAALMFSVVLLLGLTCQYFAFKRICCKDLRAAEKEARSQA